MITPIKGEPKRKGYTLRHAAIHACRDDAVRAVLCLKGRAGYRTRTQQRHVRSDGVTLTLWVATIWRKDD